ncbi:MAG: DUF2946 family protein [Nitrospirota bacterium]
MNHSIHRLMFWRCSSGVIRFTFAALILAYVALAGETIHCQYLTPSHAEHGDHSSSSDRATTDHKIHCLVANHSGSVTVNAHASAPLPVLAPTAHVAVDDFTLTVSNRVRITPSRAPPVL